MAALDITAIHSWHAHVYFDAVSRDAAWTFRQVVDERFGAVIELGRFHERLVGPHPAWSYQIAFDAARFDDIVPWLVLNHPIPHRQQTGSQKTCGPRMFIKKTFI